MPTGKEPQDTSSENESESAPKSSSIEPDSNKANQAPRRHEYVTHVKLPDFITLFNSTGTQIGGTITALDSMSELMKDLNRSAITGLQPGLDDYFTKRIEPIKNELESKLQETKKSLSSMNAFIKDNESALTSLFSVQGKMSGLESQMSSVLNRVT
jgi:hypothetical protein